MTLGQRRMIWLAQGVRVFAALAAAGSGTLTYVIIAKLYTGRGSETPVRSALIEQPLVFFIGLVGVCVALYFAILPREFLNALRWLNPRWTWRERRAEAVLLSVVAVVCLALLEVGSRAVYAVQRDFPFNYKVEELIYPTLYEQFDDYTAESTNVLLLGGSVLYFAGLENRIETAFDPPARVYNLAQTAHSSLDSLRKYEYCIEQGYRFDYIIFYHAINEVRANNCPPEMFSIDYDHYFFYRLVNTVFTDRRPVMRALLHSSLFFRAYDLVSQIRSTELGGRGLVHIAFPREDWLEYGGDVKSKEAFARNLGRIAALAQEQGSVLIVPRFVYNPALDLWADGRETEYTDQDMIHLTEQWGLPRHVLAGMKAHNDVIERMKDRYVYVNTDSLQKREYLWDACHFTKESNHLFIDLLIDALQDAAHAPAQRASE